MLKIENLYKSYLPKGELSISGCGTTIVEKYVDNSKFDNQFSVNDISISLKKNEILAILGENGSGKSTLLKLIAGLLQPDFGKITLNHKLVGGPETKLVAGHENIKLIHQNYNLFPNISLADNICYAMRFFSASYQAQKLAELLDVCDLKEISHKLPRETSGGEQQRTAIAAALSTNIDLLLLDEPFSNLDVFTKEGLKEYIRRISRRMGVSIIFVTHDAQDALSVATEVAVIRKGKILQIDTPQNIYHKPLSDYVAGITGIFNSLNTRLLKQIYTVNSHTTYGIRPENIWLSNEADYSFVGVVKHCTFHGSYYTIIVEVSKNFSVTIFSNNETLAAGQAVYLKLDESKIVSLLK